MERSRHLYTPEQFAILQEAFDQALDQANRTNMNVSRDDVARSVMAAFADDESAASLAEKALRSLRHVGIY